MIAKFIALFVVYSGINIAKSTLKPLLDQAVDKKLYEQITTKIAIKKQKNELY